MMSTSNINWQALDDHTIVQRLGAEVKRMRLEKNLSQAEVAERAGLDRTTVLKLESGRAATLLTIVQVLRALRRLEVLNAFHEEPRLTPMMALELEARYERKKRKRASPKKGRIVPPKPKSTW
jgi:transcriptional regulator with XRE-family HTH domain